MKYHLPVLIAVFAVLFLGIFAIGAYLGQTNNVGLFTLSNKSIDTNKLVVNNTNQIILNEIKPDINYVNCKGDYFDLTLRSDINMSEVKGFSQYNDYKYQLNYNNYTLSADRMYSKDGSRIIRFDGFYPLVTKEAQIIDYYKYFDFNLSVNQTYNIKHNLDAGDLNLCIKQIYSANNKTHVVIGITKLYSTLNDSLNVVPLNNKEYYFSNGSVNAKYKSNSIKTLFIGDKLYLSRGFSIKLLDITKINDDKNTMIYVPVFSLIRDYITNSQDLTCVANSNNLGKLEFANMASNSLLYKNFYYCSLPNIDLLVSSICKDGKNYLNKSINVCSTIDLGQTVNKTSGKDFVEFNIYDYMESIVPHNSYFISSGYNLIEEEPTIYNWN